MSYILEALKKSDKERQREKIPTLQADHSLPPVKRKGRKPSGWRYPIVVILLSVCFGGMFWWLLSDDQEPQLAEAPQVLPASPVSPVSHPAPAARKADSPAIPARSVEVLPEITKPVAKEVSPAVLPVPEKSSLPPVTVAEKKSEPMRKPARRFVSDPVKTDPPLMEDLPVAIRAGIPDLTFAGHVYADEARNRLIIINNRIVREGDLVSSGLSLEEISPNGVVLRYETTVFRVNLF